MNLNLKLMSELLFLKFIFDKIIDILLNPSDIIVGNTFVSHQFEHILLKISSVCNLCIHMIPYCSHFHLGKIFFDFFECFIGIFDNFGVNGFKFSLAHNQKLELMYINKPIKKMENCYADFTD